LLLLCCMVATPRLLYQHRQMVVAFVSIFSIVTNSAIITSMWQLPCCSCKLLPMLLHSKPALHWCQLIGPVIYPATDIATLLPLLKQTADFVFLAESSFCYCSHVNFHYATTDSQLIVDLLSIFLHCCFSTACFAEKAPFEQPLFHLPCLHSRTDAKLLPITAVYPAVTIAASPPALNPPFCYLHAMTQCSNSCCQCQPPTPLCWDLPHWLNELSMIHHKI